ncbi:Cuticle protein 16.8 [Nymphon striatum]|nr:Cuticle protein 16.8 [Nymphon striatum]
MKTMILILGIFIAGCFGHHAPGAHIEARHGYGKAVEIVEPPQPYQMNYDITDEYGNQRWRQESGDEYNNKKGSYGYRDAYGLSRSVDYVADEYGFRVMVISNEPGVETSNPADAQIIVDKAGKAPKESASEAKKPKPYSGYGYGQAAPKRLAPLPKREKPTVPEQKMAEPKRVGYISYAPEPMKQEIVYGYSPMPKQEPKKPEPMKHGYAPEPKTRPRYAYGYSEAPMKHEYAPEPKTRPRYTYDNAPAPMKPEPMNPEPMKQEIVYGYAPMPKPEPVRYVYQYAPMPKPEPMKQNMGYGYAPMPKPEPKKPEPVKYGYEHASAPKLQTMAKKSGYNYAPIHPEPIKEEVVYGYAPMPKPEPKKPEPMKQNMGYGYAPMLKPRPMKQYMSYGYAPMPKPEPKKPEPVKYVYGYAPEPYKPEPMKYGYKNAAAPKLQTMAKKSGLNYAPKHPEPIKEEIVYEYEPAPEPEPEPKIMTEKNVEPFRTKEVKYFKSGYSRKPMASMYPSTPMFKKQLSKPQVSYY